MNEDIKENISIDEYKDYYGHPFWCDNCMARNHRYIRKGVLLETVAFICDNCGCVITGKSKAKNNDCYGQDLETMHKMLKDGGKLK